MIDQVERFEILVKDDILLVLSLASFKVKLILVFFLLIPIDVNFLIRFLVFPYWHFLKGDFGVLQSIFSNSIFCLMINVIIFILFKCSLIKHKNSLLNTGLRSKTAKFKECKRKVQSSLRQMKDDWWNKKAEAVEDLAESGNPRAFLESLKEVYGSRHSVTAPLYNKPGTVLLTNKVDVVDRWKEHFQDLLNRPSSNALNNKDKLPCNADMDIPPSLEEIEDAIKSLKNGKAPGADGIPSEVYKYGGPSVVQTQHCFFKTCWDEAELPQDFKDAKIVTIFKKGDRSQCGNYLGISLLSTAAKFLPRSYCPDYKKLQVRYFLKANVVSEPTDLQLMQSSISFSYRKNQ